MAVEPGGDGDIHPCTEICKCGLLIHLLICTGMLQRNMVRSKIREFDLMAYHGSNISVKLCISTEELESGQCGPGWMVYIIVLDTQLQTAPCFAFRSVNLVLQVSVM